MLDHHQVSGAGQDDRGEEVLDAVAQDADSLAAQVKAATAELLSLNLAAYAANKKNLRQAEIEHVLDLLKKELSDQA